MSIHPDKKTIAQTARAAFGGKMSVTRYWDDPHVSCIDILECVDRPYPGISSFATIGVSDEGTGITTDEMPLCVEMVGACASSSKHFANILATCAFNVINSKWVCRPGTVFPDVVRMYDPSSPMQHILFVPPFLWDDRLKTLKLEDRWVAWLMAVPISQTEHEYAQTNSTDELETLFERKQIDVFNLRRRSVI
jgi:hypothetical protein